MLDIALVFLAASVVFCCVAVGFALWVRRQRRIISKYNAGEYADAYADEAQIAPSPTAPPVVVVPDTKTFDYATLARKTVMTITEREFFLRLRRALPEHYIFSQVAFSALLKPATGLTPKQRYSTFGRFAQKRADYVICSLPDFEVVGIVELDDRFHDPEKDRKRDALLQAVGYSVHRFRVGAVPSEEELAFLIKRSA